MRFSKLTLVAAVAAVVIGSVTVARANPYIPDGTYTFYATDGNTVLDGSTITFSGDAPSAWDLMDSVATTNGVPTTIPLTQNNSIINPDPYGGVLGSNEWVFEFITVDPSDYPFDTFESVDFGGSGYLFDGFGDPQGNWDFDVNLNQVSTPDASSTCELFGIALTALAACEGFISRRIKSRNRG